MRAIRIGNEIQGRASAPFFCRIRGISCGDKPELLRRRGIAVKIRGAEFGAVRYFDVVASAANDMRGTRPLDDRHKDVR